MTNNNITNRSYINNTGLNEHNSFYHLLESISPNTDSEVDLLEQSKYYTDQEFVDMYSQTNTEITILNLNCQSINARIDDLKIFLSIIDSHTKISCITLQESWCTESHDLSKYTIPNYTMITKFARTEISEHSGLIIYIHNDFNYKEILGNDSPIHETLGVEIWHKTLKNNKYIIFSVYRRHTGIVADLLLFIEKFTELLNQYRHRKMYISCDTNINLLEIGSKPHFNGFYENLTQLGFLPKITLPTRFGADSLIDNIFTNHIEGSHISGNFQHKLSDHQAMFCMLKSNKKLKNAIQYVQIEIINNTTLENMRRDLAQQDVGEKLNNNIMHSPHANCEVLLNTLTDAKNMHIPSKTRKFNRLKDKIEKWMTDDLLELVNRKNAMYIDWKTKSPTQEIYEVKKVNFRAFESIVNREKKQTKQTYYHNIFEAQKHSIKRTWNTINETLNRRKLKNDLPSNINHNGESITDPNKIANLFNSFFANIGTELSEKISNLNTHETYQSFLNSDEPTNHRCIFHEVTKEEIVSIINALDNKSSSGIDGISNKMLKYIKNEVSGAITLITNQMIYHGIFPDSLKISKVLPIYKKGDASNMSNYRPISLLPTISKIFERVIYNQLYNYFTINNILCEQQFGFRAHHSTELATIKLIDFINYEMDHYNTPVNIYIDMSKAFDTLDFQILLRKLKYYGVRDKANTLIETYLLHRKQRVQFGSNLSDETYTKTGVPQGSILGPLLFSVYINDLIKATDNFNYLMYADDTTLYFNLENFHSANREEAINSELDRINIWMKVNKLTINASKTKCMIFHKKPKRINPLSLSINGQVIETVSSFNYLGIHLDENLTWKNHTDLVSVKLSKITGILYRLKHEYPQQALRIIYNSLFLSYVNYGLLLWGTRIDKISQIQKKAIRNISNGKYNEHSEPLLKEMNLLKIQDLFYLKLLKFYYNLSYGLLPTYFNCYLEYMHKESNVTYNLRSAARPLFQLPFTRHAFADSRVLYQLIKLINELNTDKPTILYKIDNRTHSFAGFSFNVKQLFLQDYSYECNLLICYTCGRN